METNYGANLDRAIARYRSLYNGRSPFVGFDREAEAETTIERATAGDVDAITRIVALVADFDRAETRIASVAAKLRAAIEDTRLALLADAIDARDLSRLAIDAPILALRAKESEIALLAIYPEG